MFWSLSKFMGDDIRFKVSKHIILQCFLENHRTCLFDIQFGDWVYSFAVVSSPEAFLSGLQILGFEQTSCYDHWLYMVIAMYCTNMHTIIMWMINYPRPAVLCTFFYQVAWHCMMFWWKWMIWLATIFPILQDEATPVISWFTDDYDIL